MKICGQEIEVTLPVNGRERTICEDELIAILEKHFSNVALAPTEGQWFQVKPLEIDQNLFQKKRNNARQEETRQSILAAFTEMKKNPEKYGKNFKTFMPKKEWQEKSVWNLKGMASGLGDHNADWVEQALEWAQRIANGELWGAICNDADTANWYRLVIWNRKNGSCRIVGGSNIKEDKAPATSLSSINYEDDEELLRTVPLVVAYDD